MVRSTRTLSADFSPFATPRSEQTKPGPDSHLCFHSFWQPDAVLGLPRFLSPYVYDRPVTQEAGLWTLRKIRLNPREEEHMGHAFCDNRIVLSKHGFLIWLALFSQKLAFVPMSYVLLYFVVVSGTWHLHSLAEDFFISLVPAVALGAFSFGQFLTLKFDQDKIQKLVNQGHSRVLDTATRRLKKIQTRRLGVSDIVMLFEGETAPADGVLLLCSDNTRFAFVQNEQLRSTRFFERKTAVEEASRNDFLQTILKIQGDVTISTAGSENDPHYGDYTDTSIIKLKNFPRPTKLRRENIIMKGNRLLTTDWVFMLVTHTGQDSSYSRTLPLVSHLNIRAWVTERLVNFLMLIGLLPLVLLVCIVQLAHPGWINLPFPEYLFESYYVSVWFAWILLLMHQTFVICMLIQSRVLSHNIGAALNGEPVFRWLRSYLETGFPIGLSRATRLETCATRTTVGTASSDLRTLMTALHALSQRHAHNSRIPFDLNVPDRAACLPGVDVAMIKSCCFADDTFDIEFVLYGDVIYDAANRFREISLGRSAVSGTKCPLELFWLSTVLCSSCRPYLLHDINEESSEGMYQLTGDSSADEYRSVLDFRAATRPPSRRTVLPEKVAAADVAGRSAFSQTARRFQVDEHTGAVLNMHRRHFIDRRLLKSIHHDWVSHPPDRCIMDFAKRAGVCLIKRSSTQAAVHTHDQLLWFDVLAWLPGDRALSEVEVVVVREVAHSKVYCLCRGPLTKIEKLLSSTSAQLERFNCMAARQGLTASYYLSRELKPEEIQSLQQNGSTNLDRALLTKGNMDLLGGFAIRENVDSVSQEVVDLMRDNGTRVWMTSNDTLVPSLAIAKHAEVVTCGHAVFVPEKQFGFWSTDIDACVGGNKKWPRRTSLTSRASSFRSRHSSRKSRLSETSGISMTIRKKTVTFSRAITRVSSTGLNRSLFRAATRVCRSSSHQSFVPVQTLQDVMESYKPTAVNRNIQADELLRRTHAISMMFDSMIAGKRSVAVVMPGDLVRLFLDNGMILNDFLLIVVNADAVIFYNMTPLLSRRLLRAVAKHVKPRLNVLVLGDSCGDSLMMMESVVSIAYVRQPPCSLLNRDVFPNVARFNAHFVVDDWKQIRWLIEVYGHHFNGASYNLLYWMSLTGVTTLVVLLWNVGRRQVTTWQVLIFYLVVGFPVALMSVVMPKTVVSRRFAVKDYVAPQALGLLFGMVLIVVNRCIEATSIDPHGRVFDSGQTDWVFTLCFLLVGALASSGLSRRGCFWWPLTPIPVALLSLWVLTFISFIVWAFFRLREDSSWITNFRWIITCPPLVIMSAFYRAVHWAELYSRSMPLSGRLWRGSIRACWEGFAYLRDQINIRVSRATVPRSPNCDDSSDFQPASVRNELPLDKYVTVSHMMTWKLTFRECQAEHCFRVMSSNFIKDTQWSRYCRAALLSMILYVTAKVILESSNPKPQPSLSVWCGTPLVIFLMVALGFTYSDLFFKEHAKFASLLNLSFSLLLIICYAAADIASPPLDVAMAYWVFAGILLSSFASFASFAALVVVNILSFLACGLRVHFQGASTMEAMHLVYLPLMQQLVIGAFVITAVYNFHFDIRRAFLINYSVTMNGRRDKEILYTLLPEFVVRGILNRRNVNSDSLSHVTVLFCDVADLQKAVAVIPPELLVATLDRLFLRFDRLTEMCSAFKIETVFETYLCASGLRTPYSSSAETFTDLERSASKALYLALMMLEIGRGTKFEDSPSQNGSSETVDMSTAWPICLKIGLHTGTVLSGVVGSKKPQFAMFGDTVNTASRMKSTATINRIQVSDVTYRLVKNESGMEWEARHVSVKGKGMMRTWQVSHVERTDAAEAERIPCMCEHSSWSKDTDPISSCSSLRCRSVQAVSRSVSWDTCKSSDVMSCATDLLSSDVEYETCNDTFIDSSFEDSGFHPADEAWRQHSVRGVLSDDCPYHLSTATGLSPANWQAPMEDLGRIREMYFHKANAHGATPHSWRHEGRSPGKASVQRKITLLRKASMRPPPAKAFRRSQALSLSEDDAIQNARIKAAPDARNENTKALVRALDKQTSRDVERSVESAPTPPSAILDTQTTSQRYCNELGTFVDPTFERSYQLWVMGQHMSNRGNVSWTICVCYPATRGIMAFIISKSSGSVLFSKTMILLSFTIILLRLVMHVTLVRRAPSFANSEIRPYNNRHLLGYRRASDTAFGMAPMLVPVLALIVFWILTVGEFVWTADMTWSAIKCSWPHDVLNVVFFSLLLNLHDMSQILPVLMLSVFHVVCVSVLLYLVAPGLDTWEAHTTMLACVYFSVLGPPIVALVFRESTLRAFWLLHTLDNDQQQAQNLLMDMLPPQILREVEMEVLKLAYKHTNVTFLFSDICGFTAYSKTVSPARVLTLLQTLFDYCDQETTRLNLYKLCTIGDAYVCLTEPSIVPVTDPERIKAGMEKILMLAAAMIHLLKTVRRKMELPGLDMRIGLHHGDCVGGIIGSGRLRYDIYGVDVLTGNLMESHGQPGRVCVSAVMRFWLIEFFPGRFDFEFNANVEVVDSVVPSYFVKDSPNCEEFGCLYKLTNFRASQHATCNKFFMSYPHYCGATGAIVAVELLQCAAVATCAGSVNDVVFGVLIAATILASKVPLLIKSNSRSDVTNCRWLLFAASNYAGMTLGATVIVFTQYDCRDFHGGCFQTYKMQDWVPAGTAMLAMINFTLYGLHKTVLLPATDHSKYYYLLSAVMVLFGVVCVGIAHTNMQYTIVWTQCVAGWAAWLGGIVSLSFQIPKVRRLVLSSIVHAVLLLTSAGFMLYSIAYWTGPTAAPWKYGFFVFEVIVLCCIVGASIMRILLLRAEDPTQFRNQPISEETLVQKIEKHQNNDFGARKIVRAIPTVRENDLGADYLDASGREALLAYEMKAAAAMQNEEAQMNKSKKAMEEFLRAENAKGLQFSLDQLRGGIAKGGRVPVRTADGRLTLQPLSKRYRNPSWSEKLKSIVNGELSFTDAAIRKRAREQLERDIRDVHDALLQQSLLSLEENHSDQASIQDWAAGDTGGREDARVAARVAANKILHSLLKPSKTK